ncbi:MAG: type II toxin-antitoxin system RelE/ParE family toxin [Deltaproteobacteria bacterium]|nr:type II toxin-antitoxin system RelE/ParE family toxin [Deltaproteobacteria bacterium]
MWKVEESQEVYFELQEAPLLINKKYLVWKEIVKNNGPFIPGKGWHTEKLSGPLSGFYSARLNKKWRVIFEISGKIKVIGVRSVTPHLYDKFSMRIRH